MAELLLEKISRPAKITTNKVYVPVSGVAAAVRRKVVPSVPVPAIEPPRVKIENSTGKSEATALDAEDDAVVAGVPEPEPDAVVVNVDAVVDWARAPVRCLSASTRESNTGRSPPSCCGDD